MTEEAIALTGVTGHQIEAVGTFIANIKISRRQLAQKIYIIKDNVPIEYEGILDVDFLQSHNAKCDYRNRQLTILGKSLPLLPYQNYTLPARSEVIVNAISTSNKTGLVEAKEIQPGIFIGNCLATTTNNSCTVSIMNVTENTVEITAPQLTIHDLHNDTTEETCLAVT